jgi:hypothetical protein
MPGIFLNTSKGEVTLELKMSVKQAKERAIELMHRGYH